MDFRVLGTIEVDGPSPGPSPPGAKERAILARLLVDAGPHRAGRRAARGGLAGRRARRRGALARGPGREPALVPRAGPRPRRAVVAASCARARATGSRSRRTRSTPTGSSSASGRRPGSRRTAALAALDAALALWRGTPFGDFADADWAQPELRRLEDLRSQAEEERARALVALGRPLEAVPVLRRLIAADPLREELVATLMLALYGAGRQVEALEAYRRLAARLRELGLTPGDATRALERRILEHDPSAGAGARPRRPRSRPSAPPRSGAPPSSAGCARR